MSFKAPKISKKTLATAGFLFAALVILGFTWAGMMDLVSEQVSSEWQELKSARRKLRELEQLVDAQAQSTNVEDLDRIMIGAAPPEFVKSEQVGQPEQVGQADAMPDYAEILEPLPRLSGIVGVVAEDGRVRYRAILENQVLGLREKTDGYTVEKITGEGVLLGRDGKYWPIRASDAAVTLRQ